MADLARKMVKKHKGAVAVVYACPFCSYLEKAPLGLRNPGRGYGLAIGGALSSKVAGHIRREHPEKVS